MIVNTEIKARQDNNLSLAADEFIWEEAGDSPVHHLVKPHIVDLLSKHSVIKVLDLGCGNGAFTHLLHQNGFKVEGFDGSASGVELARKNYPEIQFSQLDLVSGRMPDHSKNQFDAVVSVEVIEHLLLPRMLIQNAIQALKPGGLLILTTPYHGYWKNLAIALTNRFDAHWHPLRDYGHVKFFSKKTLMQLFIEFGLKDIRLVTVGRIPALACSMIVSGRKP